MQRFILWTVAYAAMALSVTLAARYGYVSADNPIDGAIRGTAAGMAAILGCHGPAWVWRALREGKWGVALFAGVGIGLCLAVTLAGAVGTIATGSDKSAASRTNATASYQDLRTNLENVRTIRAKLPAHRPAGTVEADISAAKVSRLWQSSGECQDATQNSSRTFCTDFNRLVGELATAKEAARLDARIAELTAKLEVAPAVRDGNPMAAYLARILHVPAADAEAWYALLFALAIELGAMSVMLLAEATSGHATRRPAPPADAPPAPRRALDAPPRALSAPDNLEAPPEDRPDNSETPPAEIVQSSENRPDQSAPTPPPAQSSGPLPDLRDTCQDTPGDRPEESSPPSRVVDLDAVARFASACIERRAKAETMATVAYEAFVTWCSETGVEPMSQNAFGRRMSALGFEKSKSGTVKYLGLALKRPEAPETSGQMARAVRTIAGVAS